MAKRFGSDDGVITPYEEKVGKKIAEATGNEYKKVVELKTLEE